MKKTIFTFLLASFTTLSLLAADITNRITISFSGNKAYELRIDGRRYQSNNNRIYLNDLRPGRHSIQVYALSNRGQRSSRPVYADHFTVRPKYDMHIAVDRNGRVHFDESRNSRTNRDWNDRNDRNERNDRDWRDRDDRNHRNDRDWNDNRGGRFDNSYTRSMSDVDYSRLLQRVRSQWSATSKFNAAKDAVARDYFSTEQVGGLLQLISSEGKRLELAKMAYSRTVDFHNFSELYSLFSRNAQRELDDYTRRY